jgi:ankyrin repeat protein
VAIARALLAADSNPDYYNSQGNTPRAMARERGHQEMMELFEEFPVQE